MFTNSIDIENPNGLPNFNDGILRREILELEKDIQNKTLDIECETQTFDVPFNYKGKHFIHTTRFGSLKNNKIIVCTHGYNSNSTIFCRSAKLLAKEYRVYIFDLLGHGLSSREHLGFETSEEILDFYIESIEHWRKYMQINRFHMVGHSMGGYLSVNYCLRYPNILTKISMVSPAGITDPGPDDEIYKSQGVISTFGFKILELLKDAFTIKGIYRNIGCLRKPLYDYMHKGYFHHADKITQERIKEYNYHLLDLEGFIEKDLNLIFSKYVPLLMFPLEQRIDKLHSTVDIYYGSDDWMEKIGTERITKRIPEKFKMYTVSNSGHNIFMDNPDELVKYLIDNYDYKEVREKKKYEGLVVNINRNMLMMERKITRTGSLTPKENPPKFKNNSISLTKKSIFDSYGPENTKEKENKFNYESPAKSKVHSKFALELVNAINDQVSELKGDNENHYVKIEMINPISKSVSITPTKSIDNRKDTNTKATKIKENINKNIKDKYNNDNQDNNEFKINLDQTTTTSSKNKGTKNKESSQKYNNDNSNDNSESVIKIISAKSIIETDKDRENSELFLKENESNTKKASLFNKQAKGLDLEELKKYYESAKEENETQRTQGEYKVLFNSDTNDIKNTETEHDSDEKNLSILEIRPGNGNGNGNSKGISLSQSIKGNTLKSKVNTKKNTKNNIKISIQENNNVRYSFENKEISLINESDN